MAKILIVDDDEQLRQTIAMVLKLKGFESLEADNGATALEVARAQLPDLIISDINMPGSDGFEALTALRKDPVTAAIPLILMTGEQDSSMRKGMELGADDFLSKPFAMPDLLNAINARLKKQEVVQSAAEKKLTALKANISLMLPHELNTPLVGILGFGEIIYSCADSLSVDELKEMGKSILDSGLRLQKLIQNFLIFAQLEMIRADENEIAAMRAKVTDNSQEVLAIAARSHAEAVHREADLQEDLHPIRAEISDDLLTKITEELVSNAFKFSEAGKSVRIANEEKGNYLFLHVSDLGRGMKAEYIKNTDAYQQFDRRMHEQQGSGLGLTIAKTLVEIHGGKLSIASEEGKGTTVTVKIPSKVHLLQQQAAG